MWYVTAANGGFSAIISPTGRIESIGKRGAAEPVSGIVLVHLQKEHSLTFYQKYGDGYALLLGLVTLGLAIFPLVPFVKSLCPSWFILLQRARRIPKRHKGKNGAGE